MKEIKYRGIHPNLKQFITGLPAYGLDGEISMLHDGPNNYYDVIPETVGQYTGLKDKNGKEIYEGDVLKGEETWQCLYVQTLARFMLRGKDKEEYNMSVLAMHDFEVIGNIYENPELLEANS